MLLVLVLEVLDGKEGKRCGVGTTRRWLLGEWRGRAGEISIARTPARAHVGSGIHGRHGNNDRPAARLLLLRQKSEARLNGAVWAWRYSSSHLMDFVWSFVVNCDYIMNLSTQGGYMHIYMVPKRAL